MGKRGKRTKEPKANYVGIRLSDKELEKLEDCERATGMTKTGVIRYGIQSVWERVVGNVSGDKG